MERFAFEVVETAHVMRRDFDRRAVLLGTTRAQWRVLAKLARGGSGQRQVDLSEALDVEPITLCRMIDRLAEAGFVERRRDDEDRRAWRIHLTPRAEPVIDQLHDLSVAFHADMLDGISDADREAALRVLGRIRDNLNNRPSKAQAS